MFENKFNTVISKRRNIGINIKINSTHVKVNLGLLLLFLCKLGSVHGHNFFRVLLLVVCSVLFSYMMRIKAGYCVQTRFTNLRSRINTNARNS